MVRSVVRESTSVWSSPLVLVKKPNGGNRICLDLKAVNTRVRNKHFPIPNIVKTLEEVADKEYYSIADAKSAFHQIELKKGSMQYTAFRTKTGNWEFTRLLMGLRCSTSV